MFVFSARDALSGLINNTQPSPVLLLQTVTIRLHKLADPLLNCWCDRRPCGGLTEACLQARLRTPLQALLTFGAIGGRKEASRRPASKQATALPCKPC